MPRSRKTPTAPWLVMCARGESAVAPYLLTVIAEIPSRASSPAAVNPAGPARPHHQHVRRQFIHLALLGAGPGRTRRCLFRWSGESGLDPAAPEAVERHAEMLVRLLIPPG